MGMINRTYDSYVWGLKTRPKTIEGVILPNRFKTMFVKMVKDNVVPNMLLSGPAGCGKTTIASCLVDELEADALYMNMSLDTSISGIREQVLSFVQSMSMADTKKIFIGDECDRLSIPAMDSLKSLIEEFSSHVSFIFISNHKHKIAPEPRSRLEEIDFIFTKNEIGEMKKEFYKSVCTFMATEDVVFEKKAVGYMINMFFPDMRKTLTELQKLCRQGDLTIESISANVVTDIEAFFKFLKNKDFGKVRKYIADLSTNCNSFYSQMFDSIHKYIVLDDLPQAIILIAKYQYESTFSINTQIPLTACAIQLMAECEWNDKL